MPRQYMDNKHLWSVIETEHGNIAVLPLSANRVMIECAHGNSLPALRREGMHGSTTIDIGRGIGVRLHGFAVRDHDDDIWRAGHWSLSRDTGGDVTRAMAQRAAEVIMPAVGAWIESHEGDIAQADDIERNNAARTLEENIERHEAALEILRDNLSRCEEGETFTQYPELPTKR